MVVLESIDPKALHSAAALFSLGEWCSRWAKRTDCATGRTLYRIKDEVIAILKKDYRCDIEVRGDTDRHRGLLSIGLRQNPRRRLHFHENWGTAA